MDGRIGMAGEEDGKDKINILNIDRGVNHRLHIFSAMPSLIAAHNLVHQIAGFTGIHKSVICNVVNELQLGIGILPNYLD